MLGVLGRPDIEDPGLEGSVELPDQLKALRLARGGGVSISDSVLGVPSVSEGAWSDFSEVSGSCLGPLDSATSRLELAKNLQEKPKRAQE